MFGAADTLITGYTEAGGLLPDVQDRVDEQIQRLQTRIDDLRSGQGLTIGSLSQGC